MADPVCVSLVRLIAVPDRFQGKRVRVIGFLDLHFEGTGLFLHGDDSLFSIYANAVHVVHTREMMEQRPALNDRYVLIEGTFDREATGHRGVFPSGGIVAVTRCEAWPPEVLLRIKQQKE